MRLRCATFAYTREYLDELENKEKEEAECKAAKEAYEKDGINRMVVMTAENNAMLTYINISYKKKYISDDQCHYWTELVRPVKQKAFNWRRSDSNRAANRTLRMREAADGLLIGRVGPRSAVSGQIRYNNLRKFK